jgi:hypothetical protein
MYRGILVVMLVLLSACGTQECPPLPIANDVSQQGLQVVATPEPPPLASSLVELHQNIKTMTRAQLNVYKERLIGSRIESWSGRVVNVMEPVSSYMGDIGRFYTNPITDGLEISIVLDNNDNGYIRDANGNIISTLRVDQVAVRILAPKETALAINKDSRIIFSGTVSLISGQFESIFLSDTIITQ